MAQEDNYFKVTVKDLGDGTSSVNVEYPDDQTYEDQAILAGAVMDGLLDMLDRISVKLGCEPSPEYEIKSVMALVGCGIERRMKEAKARSM